jgi:hypothetical protein
MKFFRDIFIPSENTEVEGIYSMYYVYEHYKKDTDEIFYVGIGRIENGKYNRAASSIKRNPHWKSTTKKHGFYYKIVFESESRDEVCQKEIDLILEYGRKDLKSGSLVNKTSGGEKTFEMAEESVKSGVKKRMENGTYDKCAEIARKRMTENNPWKGKTHEGFNNKKIYQYDPISGEFINEWGSIRKAIRFYGCDPKTISWVLSGKRKFGLGYYWTYENLGSKIDPIREKWKNGDPKNIVELDQEKNIINEWASISKASKDIGCSAYMISHYLKKQSNIKGRIIRYKKSLD